VAVMASYGVGDGLCPFLCEPDGGEAVSASPCHHHTSPLMPLRGDVDGLAFVVEGDDVAVPHSTLFGLAPSRLLTTGDVPVGLGRLLVCDFLAIEPLPEPLCVFGAVG